MIAALTEYSDTGVSAALVLVADSHASIAILTIGRKAARSRRSHSKQFFCVKYKIFICLFEISGQRLELHPDFCEEFTLDFDCLVRTKFLAKFQVA